MSKQKYQTQKNAPQVRYEMYCNPAGTALPKHWQVFVSSAGLPGAHGLHERNKEAPENKRIAPRYEKKVAGDTEEFAGFQENLGTAAVGCTK